MIFIVLPLLLIVILQAMWNPIRVGFRIVSGLNKIAQRLGVRICAKLCGVKYPLLRRAPFLFVVLQHTNQDPTPSHLTLQKVLLPPITSAPAHTNGTIHGATASDHYHRHITP